ncbi:MAG: hypothetical protein GXP22_07315 [Gammaproteobacteria bacterium]|nr:hypothetical protein [Gammaproteobacteria bacterium]
MFTWSRLKALSTGKIVASTSIWIFIVPALLKVINSMNYDFTGHDFDVINFPISLLILYMSGVSFFLGSIIYYLFCPKIILNYDSYSSYEGDGGNNYALETYIKDLKDNEANTLKSELIGAVGEVSVQEIDSGSAVHITIGKDCLVFNFNSEKLRDVFWVIYFYFMEKRPWSIYISMLFHALGFIGLAYMFLYNLCIVAIGII